MAIIRLNLLERPPVRGLTLVALLISMAGLGSMLVARNQLQGDLATLQLQRDHLARVSQQNRPAPVAVVDTKAAETLARLARNLTMPWEDMLNALQTASTSNITLQKILPDSSNGNRILVSGHASDATAFLAYIGALEKDTRWQAVVPQSEETDTSQPGQPLAFSLLATWRAAP